MHRTACARSATHCTPAVRTCSRRASPVTGRYRPGCGMFTGEDWAAVVDLAMRELAAHPVAAPMYIVGYSNGGALALHHALTALEDSTRPMPAGVILLSPEIGVTRLAAIAAWQERLGHLLAFDKLAWHSILPEIDPFKYQSFAAECSRRGISPDR